MIQLFLIHLIDDLLLCMYVCMQMSTKEQTMIHTSIDKNGFMTQSTTAVSTTTKRKWANSFDPKTARIDIKSSLEVAVGELAETVNAYRTKNHPTRYEEGCYVWKFELSYLDTPSQAVVQLFCDQLTAAHPAWRASYTTRERCSNEIAAIEEEFANENDSTVENAIVMTLVLPSAAADDEDEPAKKKQKTVVTSSTSSK